MELKLTIISPEKELYNGEIRRVTLPGTLGQFTILPHHAPIVSSLEKGKIRYTDSDGTDHILDIGGGFVELSNGVISVCVT
ncbi:MAG: ATP synthase F1 subunit epsilon [Bacteroides sp.]|nr:ATP synthase F1 subunit epsilon [Bacteroides sp.]